MDKVKFGEFMQEMARLDQAINRISPNEVNPDLLVLKSHWYQLREKIHFSLSKGELF